MAQKRRSTGREPRHDRRYDRRDDRYDDRYDDGKDDRYDDRYDDREDDRYDDRYDDRDDDRYDDRYDDRKDDRYDDRDDRYDDRYDDRDDRYDDDYDDDYDDRPRRSAASGKHGSHAAKAGGARSVAATHSGKKAPSKRKKRAIIIFAIEIVALLALLVVFYYMMTVTKSSRTNLTTVSVETVDGKIDLDYSKNEIAINKEVSKNEQMKGYRNIAFFGVDSRNNELKKNTRSDTIIICSINQDNGEVKLLSVYRDTYLNLSNDEYKKCNVAYAKGGPAQAISMLNMNLDLDIQDFVTVGFSGLIDVIDALGGVEVEVEDSVVDHLNNYQISMVGKKSGTNAKGEDSFTATAGKDYTPVQHGGMQLLNGLQATAYCRVRYVGDDYARAERQRRVLTAVLAKAKDADIGTLTKIADQIFGETYTSLDLGDITDMLADITKYHVVGDEGFPEASMRTAGSMGSSIGSCVLPVDLASNVAWAHHFLFDDEGYQVTSDVQTYSQKIAADVAAKLR